VDLKPQVFAKEMILSSGQGSVEFNIEIADNLFEHMRGLMERTSLPENSGMLFIFDRAGNHTFWMKNTPLPLDIIFFDDNLRVVGIVENTRPYSLDSIDINKDSRFVLEVNAGTVKKHGINLHTTAKVRY
jgi:uncharacterized membrane protein (UPF0127 family)